MIVIIGQVGGGFRRCAPEKVEESGTNRYKQDIGNEYGGLIFFYLHDDSGCGEKEMFEFLFFIQQNIFIQQNRILNLGGYQPAISRV